MPCPLPQPEVVVVHLLQPSTVAAAVGPRRPGPHHSPEPPRRCPPPPPRLAPPPAQQTTPPTCAQRDARPSTGTPETPQSPRITPAAPAASPPRSPTTPPPRLHRINPGVPQPVEKVKSARIPPPLGSRHLVPPLTSAPQPRHTDTHAVWFKPPVQESSHATSPTGRPAGGAPSASPRRAPHRIPHSGPTGETGDVVATPSRAKTMPVRPPRWIGSPSPRGARFAAPPERPEATSSFPP